MSDMRVEVVTLCVHGNEQCLHPCGHPVGGHTGYCQSHAGFCDGGSRRTVEPEPLPEVISRFIKQAATDVPMSVRVALLDTATALAGLLVIPGEVGAKVRVDTEDE